MGTGDGGWDGTMASNMGWDRQIRNGGSPAQHDRAVRRSHLAPVQAVHMSGWVLLVASIYVE